MFGASVYRGIDKGIKILSNFNVLLALTFLILIFFLGSFQEIIALSIEAIKSLFTNFVGMNSLGITEQSDFADDWTIFYWAWWLALGPQVGLFVARISKGRTLRELVMGMLIIGSLGCFIFFAILGNYAINLELSNQLIVTDILANDGHQIAATAILLQLPFGELFVLAYCLIVIIFIVTSYDSVSYILSYHVKTTASEAYEPSKNMRLFWALVLAILPACLFLIGSNRTAMDLILLMSPPLLFLSPIFALSMIKTLRSHYALKDSTMDKNISE
jgi:BCCT family betaine/carnitine transporter